VDLKVIGKMSWVEEPKEVEVSVPMETKSLFNIYKKIKDAVKRLEDEFGDEYEVKHIQAGITITASVTPSFTGSVTTTLTKKKS
jgi:hypothetical protein